jgi:hypothetical protein
MTLDNEIGVCTICGTVHLDDEGFAENRGCRECGEWSVYSVVEMRDIVNDWKELKIAYEELVSIVDGNDYD